MRRDIRGILLHTSELVDVEESIINTYSFLFEKYREAIFYENGQSHSYKDWRKNY
jgi:hypothetical protein